MRHKLILISIILLPVSSYSTKKKLPNERKAIEFCDDIIYMPDGCQNSKNAARRTFAAGNRIKYLIPMQFSPEIKTVVKASILKRQYNITPCAAPISCFPEMQIKEAETYHCYNQLVDSVMSLKINADFQLELTRKVDSVIASMSDSELNARYGSPF